MSLKPTNSNPHAQVQVTGDKEVELAKRLILEGDEQVANIKPQQIVEGEDVIQHSDTPEDKSKNFDQKIYMFPESYNALRKELMEEWPEIWPLVGWYMAFNGPKFVEAMNAGTGLKLQFDSGKVDSICKTYLNFMRKKRGVSEIN